MHIIVYGEGGRQVKPAVVSLLLKRRVIARCPACSKEHMNNVYHLCEHVQPEQIEGASLPNGKLS